MSNIYAVIDKEGNVINTILWDGKKEWTPPEGTTVVDISNISAGIGWNYKNGKFTRPPAPEVPIKVLISQAEQQKASLIAEATKKISILQDAVDLEMATEDEKNKLTAWKRYRVILNRVDTSKAPDITWPDIPA